MASTQYKRVKTVRMTFVLALAVGFALLPSLVAAEAGSGHQRGMHRGGGPGAGHGGGPSIADRIHHLADELELTDSQKAQIESILEAHRLDMEPIHMALKDAHEVIAAARDAEIVDEAAVRDAFAATGQARADLFFAHQEVQDEVHAVLTPDQLAQLEEMKDRRSERREQMKERRHERRENRRERHHGSDG